MEQQEIWDAGTAQRYDTPGSGMPGPGVLGPTVERLAELAGGGSVVEFAIGTGRVAVPLAERGGGTRSSDHAPLYTPGASTERGHDDGTRCWSPADG